jgi:hypothetical protein
VPIIPNLTKKPSQGEKNEIPNDQRAKGITFGQILADCRDLGIVGEDDLVQAIYVIGTSRKLKHPLAGMVHGSSSSGKSHTVSRVAMLFPPDEVIHATRITPQGLYHMQTPLSHKFIVAGERSRVQDDAAADATAALRQLYSEGRITKQITIKQGNSFITEEVTAEGPIAYVETTTLSRNKIFPEDLNRALLLRTDESEGQTRAILTKCGERYSESQEASTEAIISRHREFQAGLEVHAVTIPFAPQLMDKLPAKNVEARRVGQQVLSVIEAVTLLHQFQRAKDQGGKIVATLEDYEIAKRVLRRPLAESLRISENALAFHQAVLERYSNNVFTVPQAHRTIYKNSKLLGAMFDERSLRNWVKELADYRCVVMVERGKGPNPTKWRLNGKAPGDSILPDAKELGLVSRNAGIAGK